MGEYDNDMLVRRSNWLEGIIGTEFWQDIEDDYIENIKFEIVNTEPDETGKREFLYVKCKAAVDFFAHLRGVIGEKTIIEDNLR